LCHGNLPAFDVDVFPLKGRDLSPPQAAEARQHSRDEHAVAAEAFQQFRSLLDVVSAELLALHLVEAAPDAVRLADPDGVIEALAAHGAGLADGLRRSFSCEALVFPLGV
jgi:hypothetical protein